MINLEDDDERIALEMALEPLYAMQLDDRVTPVERQSCDTVVDAIKRLLEGPRR